MLNIVLLILAFIVLPIGIGFLLYFIPRKIGYPRTAKFLTIVYALFILTIALYPLFEDLLFTKNNAKELVEEQGIKLSDKFELLKNESVSSLGDYYHTFTLKVSKRDKVNAIVAIKNADNFKFDNNALDQPFYLYINRYFGPKVTKNYETDDAFVREYFQPSGKKGYAPIFRRILISKNTNELVFEDIDD